MIGWIAMIDFSSFTNKVKRILGLYSYEAERALVMSYATMLQIFAEDIRTEQNSNTLISLFTTTINVFVITSQIEEKYTENSKADDVVEIINLLIKYYNENHDLDLSLVSYYCKLLIEYCLEARKLAR